MFSFRHTVFLAAATMLSVCFLLGGPSGPDSTAARDSAKKTESKWDVSAAHGPTSDIEFDSDEGTWISLDVSPDGKQITFDLLGDIYTMPVTGGVAELLAGGRA